MANGHSGGEISHRYHQALLWSIGLLIILAAITCTVFFQLHKTQEDLNMAEGNRYRSHQLADRLRQSSDDLTRMVRSYAATANPAYEKHFQQILDIRDGLAPRPISYERAYWDFIVADSNAPPYGNGAAESLQTLMAEEGFTDQEFRLLVQSQKRSDVLVQLETTAINAMKGVFRDEHGAFSLNGPPDQQMALDLLFGDEYHLAKRGVMEPINQFYESVDRRTNTNVEILANRVDVYFHALIACFWGILICLSAAIYTSKRYHTLSMDVLATAIEEKSYELRERKQAEKALRESEERFRFLFEQAEDGILLLDKDLSIIACNPGACRIYGASALDEVIGKTPLDFSPERQRDGRLSSEKATELTDRLLDGQPQRFNWQHVHETGALVDTEISLNSLEIGGHAMLQAIVRDVTERMRSIDLLQHEAKRSSLLLELYEESPKLTDQELYGYVLDHAVSLTDSQIGFLHLVSDDQKTIDLTAWNNEALKTCSTVYETHYPLEQAGNWVDCVHQKRPVIYNDFPTSPNQKGLPEGHAPLLRFMSVPVLEDDKVRIIFGVGNKAGEYNDHDIVQIQLVANELHKIIEHRHLDRELQARDVSLSEAQRIAHVGSWSLDIVNNELDWSDEIYRIFGLDSEAFSPSYEAFLDAIHPDDRELVNTAYTDSLETKTPYEVVHRLLLKDGTIRHVCERCETHYDEDGQPLRSVGTVQDITELKQAEEALREKEETFLHLTTAAQDAVIMINSDGQIEFWNAAAEKMFGYAGSEVVGQNVHALLAPSRFEAAVCAGFPRFAATGDGPAIGKTLELAGLRKDGTEFPLELSVAATRLQGQWHAIGIARDITERKQTETWREMNQEVLHILNKPGEVQDSIQRVLAALKTRTGVDAAGIRLQVGDDFPYLTQQGFSEDFLLTENTLIERGEDGGVCCDKDGNVCLECTCGLVISGKTDPANPLFTKGGSCWVNDSFPMLDIPPDKDLRLHPRNQCIHQNYASVALVPIRSKGRIVGLIQLNDRRKGCFTLGMIEILEGIAAHIGETLMRKQAEEDRLRLSTAIDQAAEAVVITDAEGDIEYVNPVFEVTTGYSKEEAIGENPRILKSGLHDDAFYKELWKQISSGQSWKGNLQNKRKDGSIYTEESVISPVHNTSGAIVNYVAVKRDITKELLLEEQYRHAQKMSAIGRLAGGVAHDFNNILQTILGFCGILLMETQEQETLRNDVLEIQNAAKRAASLTRQLLTFSRKQKADYSKVDINTIVGNEEKMLGLLLDENLALALELVADLKPVKADVGQMEQVVMNLVVNARDAMPDGGVITIRTKNIALDLADRVFMPQSRPGEFVCLSVSDAGVGMDKGILEHLFEPFFTTKTVGKKGTGLGLAVVYGIVQQHKGWIDVDSEVGKGSIFKVYLPVYDDVLLLEDESGKELQDNPGRCGHGERILLVEDDPEVNKLSTLILRDAGYTVVDVENATQAMEAFERENGNFDLLFSDVVLPDRTGIQLADALLERKAGLPVILFSGHSDERIKLDSIRKRGFNYLRKPFQLTTLLDTVRRTFQEAAN